MAICFLLRQEKLTGGPGSPGLPGDPSFPCQTQTKGILKHVCENGNVYQAQSHANAIPWYGTSFDNPEKKKKIPLTDLVFLHFDALYNFYHMNLSHFFILFLPTYL